MFKFKLVLEDGTPADPPTFAAAVPNWKAGDTIPLGAGRSLRVVEVRERVLEVSAISATARERIPRCACLRRRTGRA